MTSLEFAQYLATQPWGAEYYQNLSNNNNVRIKDSVISGAFNWDSTPQEFHYWSNLSGTVKLNIDDTWPNLRTTIADYFSIHHPELLI